jgi:hypothetical protein
MKTVALIIICALGLTFSASAQKVIHAAPHYYPRTRVSVGVGLGAWGPYYPYWYSPFYAYPPYAYGYSARPSKLDLEIEDIRNDYKDKIWSVRHDESLSRKARRQQVHELKHQRDEEILQAKKDYYKRH